MAKYIFQLRRGIKDDATERDDWATYETQPGHIAPLEGELVLEYDNGVPRLKIGDGVSEFSQLEYMSVDSFILPKYSYVTLQADAWQEIDGRYGQRVNVQNAVITPCSKVDLNPTPEMLAVFHEKDVAFVAENDNAAVTVYCVGQKPANTYEVPVTITEVICDG